ncbi:MAG: transcription-repair coupling factor, partial [Nitrospinaceae bacterium]|nr:transcription-repair coupling factor [Nitrospinaceae bacterium]NIR57791.1 transcription-repair coupling factor [Nitrospinaceae bacterium]NIS88250.1 transcription-repair coupling factor [Nitrospinaceae bacterium]NIT85131.1 transcription-repair coupling factor [Nitrospinaceae bacterium]NIU47287.1 transcription-repair coupling factor [Nitrospinaceae bacterium]
GQAFDPDLLVLCLTENGYQRSHLIEERGQFSSRGDILDVFPPYQNHPLRIEFFGEEIESLRLFDLNSQISFEDCERVTLLPIREMCLSDKEIEEGVERILKKGKEAAVSRHRINELVEKIQGLKSFSGMEMLAPFFYPEMETLFDYLPQNALLILDDTEKLNEKCAHFDGLVLEEYDRCRHRGDLAVEPHQLYMDGDTFFEKVSARPHVSLSVLKLSGEEKAHPLQMKQVPQFQGKFDVFARHAREWVQNQLDVTIAAPTKGHVKRMNELLVDHELNLPVETGSISQGFEYPGLKKVFVAEHEIFGRTHKHRQRRKSKTSVFQRGFKDLKEGDLLVHVDYGIGQYLRTKELSTGIGGGEFLEILFAEDQKLYIPMDGLACIQKYVGSGNESPVLSRLGGVQWKRQKKKIRDSLKEMAGELLKVYASRKVAEGYAYNGNSVLMQDFADSFEYVETEDQLKAIEEVLEDMGNEKPMDRLICGDVGYGKTEVAMRAAYRAVLDKKQVAVLAPTTILAQQHWITFMERFHMHPVEIEMVSRFRTSSQQKESLKKLKEGKVDVIIGTHRLLSKDVQFADLGLVIVDEEQRFGVKHKEQLKKLRASVDILTLSATPIPRTLHFSLMGVRDLSVIETPPSDRLSIKTYVRKFDEDLIREAILRELDRGGQIYFVHNKVHNIHSIAVLLKKIIPEVKIGIAHGQLQERMLEKVMSQFIEKEIDLLLCTSIVESGLDIPSANTIIINRADQFGLAQLYQLRGRVGRYKHQAYAYLMIPGTMAISEDARKRLVAIEEMSDLGAGFQLAARDMEIRGTGNMLGHDQSGHISSIGFDLYCKMLEETIREMKGQKIESRIQTEMDLKIKGYIPKDYVSDLNQRLEIYRRLQLIDDFESLESLKSELVDRYGNIPEEVEKLLVLLQIKLFCHRLDIAKVHLTRENAVLTIDPSTRLSTRKLMGRLDSRMKLVSENQITLAVSQNHWREDTRMICSYLTQLMDCIDDD